MALALDADARAALQQNGMRADHSWAASAADYVTLYRELGLSAASGISDV